VGFDQTHVTRSIPSVELAEKSVQGAKSRGKVLTTAVDVWRLYLFFAVFKKKKWEMAAQSSSYFPRVMFIRN
jgi:hypothetical protein